MDSNIKYDVAIIGGGPIGLACGIAAQKAGLSFIIFEKGSMVNSLYNYPLTMTFFSTSEKLEIGDTPFVTDKVKPQRLEALEYYRRIAIKFDLNIRLFEMVLAVDGEDGEFTINTSKANYIAKKVIVSTGFYDIPVKLGIPGEELNKVSHYYRDPNYYALQKVVVVGASNSSVDAALETYRKGAEVTMVIRDKAVGERVKYWVRPDIINRIEEGAIKAYFNSNLVEISEDQVVVDTPDGRVIIDNDFVLALTGYQPDLNFLKHLKIKLSDDEKKYPQYNPETMETNRGGMYLAGVICGGMDTHKWFIENSRQHADLIIKHIAGNHD
jgi:thioredoxin reductase (NADPH)